MATLKDLRSAVLKKPEALASYEDEKKALVREMAELEQGETESEKEEVHVLA